MGNLVAPMRSPRAQKLAPRGRRHLGPVPKIIALVATTLVTLGVVGWALMPRSDAPTHPLEAVFLGDSYTVGVGSDGPDWPTTVATELGWNAVNLALGGTGYATEAGLQGCGKAHCGNFLEQADTIIGAPDVIIVAGGRNDTAEAIGPAAAALFKTLHAKHPECTIIALSPWTDDGQPTPGFLEKVAAVKKAAADTGTTYIDTGQPFVGRTHLISGDGIHPNAAGYTKLADVVTPLLAKALSTQ